MRKRLPLIGFIVLDILVVIGLAGVLSMSYRQAQRFTHSPAAGRSGPERTPAAVGVANYREVTLTTSDGLQLAAWYVPSVNGAAVIALHGFQATRNEMLEETALLAKHGYGVLLFDARAHGLSQGEELTFGLKEIRDVRAALDYLLIQPDVDPNRIGALGNSQGAVTLLLATAEYPEIKAYAGNSPYAALPDEIATGVKFFTGLPPFPFAPLIQFFAEQSTGFQANAIAPVDKIAAIAPRPVYLMQGGRDTVIPVDSGQRLYDAAREPKTLWFDPEVEHVGFDTARPEEYERRVIGFFDEYLK